MDRKSSFCYSYDINRLYEGYIILLQEWETNVFGKVAVCLEDTFGHYLWEGFKEGVGVSRQKCRNCYYELMKCSVCSEKNYLQQKIKNFMNNIARKSRVVREK